MKYMNVYNNKDNDVDGYFTCVDSVELWIESLAKAVGIDGWKSDMNFTQCGGDSFQLVRLINLIDEKLGTKVRYVHTYMYQVFYYKDLLSLTFVQYKYVAYTKLFLKGIYF